MGSEMCIRDRYLPGANGGKRSGDSKKLSRWQDVLKKMQTEGFAVGDG